MNIFLVSLDTSKPQKKDRPPVRPSSAVRKTPQSSTSNLMTSSTTSIKSTSGQETPKRSDKKPAVPKKVVTL